LQLVELRYKKRRNTKCWLRLRRLMREQAADAIAA